MNYKKALDWLDGFQRFGIKLGLERIEHICEKLGNPQKNYKIIHVAGTNGKGSVCKFLESILRCSGYNVGIYLSPHLQRFSERIIVNNKEISESEIVSLVKNIKPIVDEMNENPPTYFEIVTAMAFQYFKEKNVEFAVVEVGLGGRYDATNIVDPIATVITNVTLEHQNILGKKVEEIAFQKAGIVKDNVPLITAASGKALNVIKEVASEKNSPVTIVNDTFWEKNQGGVDWQEFLVKGRLKEYVVKTSLGGKHQGENIAVTLATIEKLQMNGVYITDESIFNGIEKTIYAGRMEIVGFEPLILLDGAHNVAGINCLKDTLKEDFVYDKLILVLGILSDKNVKEMLKIITPLADVVVTTKSHNERASDPHKLKEMIKGKEVVIKDKIPDAIDYAKKIAKKSDLICITGSLFTVGESRDYLQKC